MMIGGSFMRRVIVTVVVLCLAATGAHARSVGNPDCGERQYSTNVVAAVQDALREAGLFKGPSDGRLLRSGEPLAPTVKAIESYRSRNRLPASGRIDLELLRSLLGSKYPLTQAQELSKICDELTRDGSDSGPER
jgi:hypothetical protein